MLPENPRRQFIYGNLLRINEAVKTAAENSGRSFDEITLVVVSKNQSVEDIRHVIDFGIRNIGENRIQEALPKIAQLKPEYPDVIWHMVGHLQSNKARLAVKNFAEIQSVDSLKLVHKLSNIAGENNLSAKVLIEVNISGEKSKSGINSTELKGIVAEIIRLPNISLKGLMTIGPLVPDRHRIRQSFCAMKKLFYDLRQLYPDHFEVLSMGMSDDYTIAIEEGSTMVRIGRAVFGDPIAA